LYLDDARLLIAFPFSLWRGRSLSPCYKETRPPLTEPFGLSDRYLTFANGDATGHALFPLATRQQKRNTGHRCPELTGFYGPVTEMSTVRGTLSQPATAVGVEHLATFVNTWSIAQITGG
jgi:hypothetical protein